MNTITIKDQTIGGERVSQINLEFEDDFITVKELIIARVQKEVLMYNSEVKKPFIGLVVPDKLERILNKKATPKKKIVDFEKQSYIALDGFMKNQFFVIINDKQVENLDDEINLASIQEIEFIKLTPLVGG